MLKKTVVLINPINPDPPPNYFGPPYGLSLIGATLLKDGRDTRAYDFDLEPLSLMLSSTQGVIEKDKPRYIAVAIQSCTRGPVYELIKLIKKIDKTIIVILGGPFATLKYKLLLKNFPVDYVVIGDGERSLVELLNRLDNKGDVKNVKGIAFLLGSRLCKTQERQKVTNLDLLPYPAFHLFKDFDKKINAVSNERKGMPNFILGKRCTTLKNALLLLSSRGCIYNCNFCPMSQVSKDKIRFHTSEYFVDMAEHFYRKYKIKDYVFGDNTFTLVKERVVKICDEIIKRDLKIQWSCMTRADYIGLALLKKMAKAGCFEISYGVESGSLRIQRIIRKNLDLALTKKAFAMTRKAGIRSILMLMIGNLGETEETISQTLTFVKDMDPDSVLVKIVKVYPGTEIHDIFEERGLLKKDYYLSDEFNPPTFTVEHPEETIKKFSEMINTRITFIQINNSCNNNCKYCFLNEKLKSKSLEEIKKELALASVRGERVVLCGGEPFLRRDIFDIIEYAERLDIHHLDIYSNSRLFFYKSLPERINNTKVRKIIIPFFGFSEISDEITRAKGAFNQTVGGIRNIKKHALKIRIEAKIFLLNSNYKSLLEIVQFLYGLGVDEFRFVFMKDVANSVDIGHKDSPSFTILMPLLNKTVAFIKGVGRSFYLEGFPLCVLKSLKNNIIEPYYPFDEIITLSKKILNYHKERQRNKKKFRFCLKCKEKELCEGVWRRYIQYHGTVEFKPY